MIIHAALIYKTVYIRMSLRKSIDLTARNDNNNEIAFFIKAHTTFIIVYTSVMHDFPIQLCIKFAMNRYFWQMLHGQIRLNYHEF